MRQEEFGYRFRQMVLGALRRLAEWHARWTNRRFHCSALAGAVRDGIFVNSDMTVSCNCQDVDGSGRLGSLRVQRFEDIFAGPVAAAFRRRLAAGQLPTSRCPACFHLSIVPVATARDQLGGFSLPQGLSVENTVRCNLRCLSCCRAKILETRGAGHSLSPEDVEIVAQTLRRLGARYCGFYNLGEPFFSPTIGRQLAILRRLNPEMELLTSTNGLLLDSDEKRQAAMLVDDVLVSIDGVSTEMVRRYQRGGDFDRAYRNLAGLVRYRDARGLARPRIQWKYVLFRWNDKPCYVRRAIELARDAGADAIQFVFARTPVYGTSWRYLVLPFYRSLGVRDGWRTRCVWLRPARTGLFSQDPAAAPENDAKAA